MFTKEQYLEMVLDELDFADIKRDNGLIAHLAQASKERLVKFYEILCDETLKQWQLEQIRANL